jgi:hypothetical protein
MMMEPTKKVAETALAGVVIGVLISSSIVQFIAGSVLFGVVLALIAVLNAIVVINTLYRFENYQENILIMIESLIDKITNHDESKTTSILSALAVTISKDGGKIEDIVSKVLHKVLSEE